MSGIEGDDDEDFPLDDHPGPGGPKAGDREMNRARDLQHLDVKAGLATTREPTQGLATTRDPPMPESYRSPEAPLTATPSSNPVVAAWQAFKTTSGYTSAINSPDPGWSMFMAGYAARDSRP